MASALVALTKHTLTKQHNAADADIVIYGAGATEANGVYERCYTNFMNDGGIPKYKKKDGPEQGHEKDWKWHWLIAYYDDTTQYGPAWYIQQGVDSAYVAKLKKNPEGYPDLSTTQPPTSGWHIDTSAWAIEKIPKKQLPILESAVNLKAATILLQHMENGKDVTTLSREASTHIKALAEEARRLKLPGAIPAEPLWIGAKSMKAFNEVRGEKSKKVRPAYAKVVNIMQDVMEADRKAKKCRIDNFPTSSNKDFRGDNRLYHIPRMLTKAENEMLVKGISQRGKALRQFILDMNKSRGVEMMACVRAGALPESVYRRIAARAAHKHQLELADADVAAQLYWSVWYGPDIIRGPDENGENKFFVVEDNFGYVGGFGDLIESRKILLKTFPELEPAIGSDLTSVFYDEMAKHYLSKVAPGEKVVALYYQRHGLAGASECSDNEDRRTAMLFKRRGIITVPLPGNDGPLPGQPRLEVRKNKVFLVTPAVQALPRGSPEPQRLPRGSPEPQRARSPAKERLPRGSPEPLREKSVDEPPKKKARADGATEEPVGMVVLLSEPSDVQPGHVTTKVQCSVEKAKFHIDTLEDEVTESKLKAKGAEKTVLKVNGKMELVDKDGSKICLQMKGDKLFWTVEDNKTKEVTRVTGPLSWDALSHKLSGPKDGAEKVAVTSKFDEDTATKLQKSLVLEDLPMAGYRAKKWADELRTAVENVGQLVGGRANDKAPEELFRLLRAHDKEGWNLLMKGKRGVPNLLECYFAGGVKLANGPGFVILDDKELCAHTDKLVKFYLNEEPILNTIPTRSFGMEPDLLSSVFDDPATQENVVVKRVDGRGGDAVWVGAKLSRSDFLAAKPLAEAEPDAFLVQRYTALSQVDNHLVDLRGPAMISSSPDDLSGGDGVAVSPVLWGRGVPEKGGNGKVNISDAGFQLTIATSPDA